MFGFLYNTGMSYILATIAAITFWGSSFIGTKFAYISFTPVFTCFLRFLLAWLVLFLIRFFVGKEQVEKKDHFWIALSALVGISLYYMLENIALGWTSSSYASLITGSYPVISILIGFLFFKEKLTKRMVAGMCLALCGVVVLSNVSGGSNLPGNAILVFDGVLWGLYNYMVPRFNTKYSAVTITYYQTLYGVVFLVPFALMDSHTVGPITVTAELAVIFLGTCCSVAAYVLYTYGLRKVSCATAASLANLMPVIGVVLSYLLLKESISLIQALGGAAILTGVIISNS